MFETDEVDDIALDRLLAAKFCARLARAQQPPDAFLSVG